jgi:pimeloyl-ACP methyl ester carboxylesterase
MNGSGLRAHYLERERAFLRYLDIPGDGPPLVWVHGWQCSSTGELLPAAVQAPLKGRRSLLVDLFGHGYSDKPVDFTYTLVDHARTVVDLLESLGFDEFGLVGHSMGGEICIRVAAALPDRVTLLVMAEGTLDPHGEEVFSGQTEDEFADTGFAALLAAMRERATADPTGVPAVHLGLTSGLEPRAIYREDVSMRDGHDPAARSLLGELAAERWYLWGALSDPQPEFDRGIEELGVTVARVPGTGHAMGLQNPEGLAEAIAGIVSTTWSAPRLPSPDSA